MEAELKISKFGDDSHAMMSALTEHLRAATAPIVDEAENPVEMLSLLMAASSFFSGTLLGTLIISGAASDQDKRRVTESMSRNFRMGIELGKARALRSMECEGQA